MFKYLKNNRGFTLIELLIVIGILAILATTVVMVINPAEMVKQSRDGNRMAELQSINKALLVYQSFGGSSSMGTSNIIYISLPDSDSQCGSYYGTLSATSTGWNYHCSPAADYRETDGTGWIPVDLTSVESSSGSLFASLPIDSTNTATGQLYYTYIPGSWALSTLMESTKYLAANATSDGGQSSTRFEVGNNLSLNSAVDCTGFTYGGQEYGAVIIGTQCWMSETLNVGTMTAGANTQGTDCPSASEIEKYCYDNLESNCTADGGLYQWNQAMCGSTTDGAQGICPDDWHVATDAEWHILENYLKDDGQTCDAARTYDYDCIPAGTKLNSGGSANFDAVIGGYRTNNGTFNYINANGQTWSSLESGANAWIRLFLPSNTGVFRRALAKVYGLNIRCVKD
jgi:uncharacterized protein (TIGR02145 family)/prepilin-type N-terminal cleavage/methylation domain-containing protein